MKFINQMTRNQNTTAKRHRTKMILQTCERLTRLLETLAQVRTRVDTRELYSVLSPKPAHRAVEHTVTERATSWKRVRENPNVRERQPDKEFHQSMRNMDRTFELKGNPLV